MAFSFNSYTGDGATTVFTITFNYLSTTVVVSSDPKGIEVHLDGIKQTGGYAIDTSLNRVTITPAPVLDVDIKVLRVTPRGLADRLVDFADATIITEAQLDTMAIQLLYISQEAFEQSSAGGSATPTYLAYNETGAHWDATYNSTAQTIKNLSEPQSDDAAASKLYVDNVATWGISGVPQSWVFGGTGATDTFTLTGAPYVKDEMLVVAIDGVLQVPGDDFSVEGDAVDSILDFGNAPDEDTVISVQNFGKMRFLDGLDISDGSVTTAKLDQTPGSEAVDTATIRTDAVTQNKIADNAVDEDRINTADFVNTAPTSSTDHFMKIVTGTKALSHAVLTSSDITDFNSQVQSTRLSAFAAPNVNVSFNNKKITNLAAPTSDTHAANKVYVDDAITAGAADAGIIKIASYSFPSTSDNFEVTGWYNAAYTSYEFECYNFTTAYDSGGAYILMRLADSTGTYRTGTGDVRTRHVQYTPGAAIDARMGYVSNLTDDPTTEIYRHNFRLWLPNNRTGFGDNKMIIAEGYGQVGGTGNDVGKYSAVTYFMYNTSVVTKIMFRASDSIQDTTTSSHFLGGARVIVYGRTF